MNNAELVHTLTSRGLFIFPCNENKQPLTKNGFKDATIDQNIISTWFKKWPLFKIGIPAEINGFFAVDVDPDGLQTWESWIKENGSTGAGPCQRTPRGGLHILFKLPEGVKVPNNAGQLAPGIDLRSRGYICTGKGYEWFDNGHGPAAELTEAPEWLISKIAALSEQKTTYNDQSGDFEPVDPIEAATYWLNKALDRARPGNRNETGFWLACQLRDSGLSQNEAARYMRDYAAKVPGTDYPEAEAMASLREAYRGQPRKPATLPGAKNRIIHMEEIINEKKEEVMTMDIQAPPPEIVEYVRGYEPTDTGNGQRFISLHGPEMRWVDSAGRWFIWDGMRWAKDINGEVERRAKDTARSILQEAYQETDKGKAKNLTAWAFKSQGRAGINNMIELAKSEHGITIPLETFDQSPDYLNFRNGTLDLRTGELKSHNPEDYITKLIDLDYNERATCPRWLQFLDEIMDHNEPLINFLQRAVGYTLTGDTGEQVFFTCYGKGANGKSVFLETVLNALGPDYAINTQAKTILVKDRQGGINNDVARLRGLRFVTVNEIPGRGKLDEAKVKEFTGGDTITARYLFQEEFSFKPEFKLWVRTNHKPIITGVDLGIWRRVRLLPFTVTIPPEAQDTKLQDKLREEWPGILTWAVLGCLAWRDEGLPMPDEVKAATAEYKHEQDTMQPFIEDRCNIDKTNHAKASELYTAYKAWAEINGERAMTNTAFGRELSERGFEKKRDMNGNNYAGIALKKE
jgi:putative DNA primase/helicase